jgi:hypothetical protein
LKIYYDTEFIEDGSTIDLISIGMVTEDGDEYYAINANMPCERIEKNQWLMDNVVPSLPFWPIDLLSWPISDLPSTEDPDIKTLPRIAYEVSEFILSHQDPELWAWYAAYDHVVLAQLWGRMDDLPDGIPMWTGDLHQEAHRLGNPELPEQPSGVHNALHDARHNLVRARHLAAIEAAT